MPEPKKIKPSLLIQLDTDPQPSVFDAVVAIDSGVDHLLRHGGVHPEVVRDLVHGALFTRGIDDLRRTALFVGGSDILKGEAVLFSILETFFGPFRVSVLIDSKGATTTAAAAVLAIGQSLGSPPNWDRLKVAIIGAGPVGHRAARLLKGLGAQVQIGSPDLDQATEVADHLREAGAGSLPIEPFAIDLDGSWVGKLGRVDALLAAGPAGVEILPTLDRSQFRELQVAIDLNAVPPSGLRTIKPTDRDVDSGGVQVWGALGVGALKVKIHKAVVAALFDGEPTVFDVEQVYEVGRQILSQAP